MPRGARPGERRGGREKGTPNSTTGKLHPGKIAEANDGGPQPLGTLINIMRYHMGRAAAEQQKGIEANEAKIEKHLEAARLAARDAAPYRHPRLAAIQMSDNATMLRDFMGLEGLSDAELREFERLARKVAPAGGDRSGDQTTRH